MLDRVTLATAFSTIFLAEMGDKTQLAAVLLTASSRKPFSVLLGAATALTVVTALGVFFGEGLVRLVPERVLQRCAAAAFVAVGVWMWAKA